MYSRLSKFVKTEDPNIRYKDCDISGKVSSTKKKSAKIVKEMHWVFRVFKTSWGEVSLN
jgi:hypothetical protein